MLDSNTGLAVTDWFDEGGWHYLDTSSGVMKVGWVNDAGTWYYIDSNGVMATGWRIIDGQSYYLRPDWGGAMAASGTLRIDIGIRAGMAGIATMPTTCGTTAKYTGCPLASVRWAMSSRGLAM